MGLRLGDCALKSLGDGHRQYAMCQHIVELAHIAFQDYLIRRGGAIESHFGENS